jgi:hypothetical protein
MQTFSTSGYGLIRKSSLRNNTRLNAIHFIWIQVLKNKNYLRVHIGWKSVILEASYVLFETNYKWSLEPSFILNKKNVIIFVSINRFLFSFAAHVSGKLVDN